MRFFLIKYGDNDKISVRKSCNVISLALEVCELLAVLGGRRMLETYGVPD